MKHILATGYRLCPACVIYEIGGHKRKLIARIGAAVFQHSAYIAFALQAPYRGPYLVARREKLDDGMAADKT